MKSQIYKRLALVAMLFSLDFVVTNVTAKYGRLTIGLADHRSADPDEFSVPHDKYPKAGDIHRDEFIGDLVENPAQSFERET